AVWHILLPAFALALAGIGQAARLTRSNMAETYDRPFIEMARSYGFPEWKIANHYAFRPSVIPSLTIIGLDFERAFHDTYEREYTYRLDAPVEMVGVHLVASAEVGKLKMMKREGSGAKAEAALKGRRKVDYALE